MEMERKKNDVVLRFGAKEREDATKRYQTLRRKRSRFGIGFGAGTA
jgi:adenine specific DNA methylase Mod